MAREFSCLRTQVCDILALFVCLFVCLFVYLFIFTTPHHSPSCHGGVLFCHSTHPWESSRLRRIALPRFSPHMPLERTQRPLRPIYTPNPITRQDSPTIARQKGINARKRRSSIKQHRKASRTPSRKRNTQAKHEPTLLHASFRSRIETKARRAASRPSRHPPRCLSHGRSFEASGRIPWLHDQVSKPSRLSSDRSVLPIPVVGIGSPRNRDTAPAGAVLLKRV